MRKLHRSDGVWKYNVGKQHVVLFSPKRDKYIVACEAIAGVGDWERAKWKGYDQITPSQINKHIDNMEEKCRHDSCKECNWSGIKKDGTVCMHIISCKCKKCRLQ